MWHLLKVQSCAFENSLLHFSYDIIDVTSLTQLKAEVNLGGGGPHFEKWAGLTFTMIFWENVF